MSKGNLKSQLSHAISECNAMGQSRRSDKFSQDDTAWKIYSRGEMTMMKTAVKDIGAFIMDTYPDIKMVTQIRTYHIQDWLNQKAETCGQATITKDVSILHKMEACCDHVFHGVKMNAERVTAPQSLVTEKPVKVEVMDEDRHEKLNQYLKEQKYDTLGRRIPKNEIWKAEQMAHACGLRTQEATHIHRECITFSGGKFGYGTVSLRSGDIDGAKHGRPRTIDIVSPQAREELLECVKGVKPGETVIRQQNGKPYTEQAVYKAYNRAMQAINDREGHQVFDLEKWKFNKGNHPLRKMYGQSCYDLMRNMTLGTMSEKDSKASAVGYANSQLGHGQKRESDLRTYVPFMW